MLQKQVALSLLIHILFLPPITPEESYVHEYRPDNFKRQIEEMDGNFIMFYAPWCQHCTDFYPIWSELAEAVNTKDSRFAIAQVDCTLHSKLCHENSITGYPTLLYFHRNSFLPIEYKGTRDLPSLTLFLSEAFNMKAESADKEKLKTDVNIYSGMAYLNDHNIEKFISKGTHFVMFYAPWCKASQKLAPTWAELAVQYTHNPYLQVGKVNCMENEMTCKNFDIKQYPYLLWIDNGRIVSEFMGVADEYALDDLKAFVAKMVITENHDPEKFMKKKKVLPVARITEETFETFLEKELVFINYFASWCAHCMQLNLLWLKLGEKFQNESRVLIADVDCVRSKAICETEKINSLPTLILYKNKELVKAIYGSRPLDKLISVVNEHLQETSAADTTNEEQTVAKDEL